jgi:cell division protein ZapA (FtsZ GTPase activity inhibitor)
MSNFLRVKIGGKEYTLRGDNEQKLLLCARQVDAQFQQLQGRLQDQSTATMAIVAALNLAENGIDMQEQAELDALYIASELEEMAEFLEKSWKA